MKYPRNRVRIRARRHRLTPMQRTTYAAAESIQEKLMGARSLGELRNRLRKIADDAEFWKALGQYATAMGKLKGFSC